MSSPTLMPRATSLLQRYIPTHPPVSPENLTRLRKLLDHCQAVRIDGTGGLLVLTGAGVSTESGIPDYRSPIVGAYAKPGYRPIQYAEFVKSAAVRRRYWARNYVGWPRFRTYEPNRSHEILASWERTGRIRWLITQNVDHLHHKAGNSRVTELHGCMNRVSSLFDRATIQDYLQQTNQGWLSLLHEMRSSVSSRPDADAEVPQDAVARFKPPICVQCGSDMVQPDVVFFGDNVPRPIVDSCMRHVENAGALLVLGSSLEVMSSFRFARHAVEVRKPIIIVNIGPTRADGLATFKVDGKCSDVLENVFK